MHAIEIHASDALTEADRLMTVCNSCRYCEGLCAVFPAMEMRRAFGSVSLDEVGSHAQERLGEHGLLVPEVPMQQPVVHLRPHRQVAATHPARTLAGK